MFRKGQILFSLIFYSINLPGQLYTFDHLGIQNGMSQNQVNAITKDDHGFMWFGTWDGLNMYNGYEFKVFKHKAFDTTSLSSNFVTHLLCDDSSRIWIGTNGGGLNLYIPEKQSFKNIEFDPSKENCLSNNGVTDLIQDSQGNVWVSTQFGLNLIESVSEENEPLMQQFFFSDPISGEDYNHIQCIAETGNSEFLLGSQNGIIRLQIKDGNKFIYTIPKSSEFPNLNVKDIFKDNKNKIWLGTTQGLFILTLTENNSNTEFKLEKILLNQIKHENEIIFIDQDSDGNIWVSSTGGRLYLIPQNHNKQIVQIHDNDISRINEDMINYTNFYQSPKENIIWLGTDIDGVKKLTDTGRNFHNILYSSSKERSLANSFIYSVYYDRNDNFWIGTQKGLSIIKKGQRNFYNYGENGAVLDKFLSSKIRAFEEDEDGNLWIGTLNGLAKIEYKGDPSKLQKDKLHIYIKEKESHGISTNHIYDVHKDQKNKIWVGTDKGLFLYDQQLDRFNEIDYLPNDFYDKNSFIVKNIFEDSKGNLWLSSSGGLHRLSNKSGFYEFGHFFHDPMDRNGICSNEVNHITEDKNGDYWIATAHGLNKLYFRNSKASFDYYGSEKGLPNEYLYSVFPDSLGNLWMSSNKGIIRFDMKNETFKSFVKEDGIQSNEFNLGAFCKARNGNLIFGGIAGITEFDPEKIIENTHKPKVQILSVTRFGKEIYSFLELLNNPEIQMTSEENSFSVEFAALDYTNPGKNQYAYKMEGSDKNWVDLGNQRSVTFTELRPGNYKLQIRGSNNNGIWNEAENGLKISISPPLWQRPEFFSALILVLALSVYFYYRKTLSDKVRKVLEMEKMQNAMQDIIRKNAAADFHDEMGHYLTRINVLTEVLKQRLKDKNDEIKGVVNSIGEQSQKLYNGTRDFIWTINPDNNSVHELAIRLKDFGDELTLDTTIDFQVFGINDSLKGIGLSSDSARHLVLLFKEAVNNAVKHSHASKIELYFDLPIKNSFPIILLKDNGAGFDEKSETSGSGLQNMKKRAKKINSELQITSDSQNGTQIKLIPKGSNLINLKSA